MLSYRALVNEPSIGAASGFSADHRGNLAQCKFCGGGSSTLIVVPNGASEQVISWPPWATRVKFISLLLTRNCPEVVKLESKNPLETRPDLCNKNYN